MEDAKTIAHPVVNAKHQTPVNVVIDVDNGPQEKIVKHSTGTEQLKAAYRRCVYQLDKMYLKIRRFLPAHRHLAYSGVIIDTQRKHLDQLFPSSRGYVDIEDYEAAIVKALKEHVRQGDSVLVIGGGMGVTACVAALRVGKQGRVVCFEGNIANCRKIRRVAALNGVDAFLVVREGIVSDDIGVYAGEKAVETIPVEALPACDVLQLDCEGAERLIVTHLPFRPRVIIVETHGFLGSTTQQISEALSTLGYDVKDVGVAEPRLSEFCTKNDIRCLVAQISSD